MTAPSGPVTGYNGAMISLPKLALLIVFGAVAWYGWQIWKKKQAGQAKPPAPAGATRKAEPAAEDMVKCAKCGAYFPASARQCTQPGCVT